jgi:RNase P subunit RPR2
VGSILVGTVRSVEKEYLVSLSGIQTKFYILTPGSPVTTPSEISAAVYKKKYCEGISGISSKFKIPVYRSFKRTVCLKSAIRCFQHTLNTAKTKPEITNVLVTP